MRRKEKKKEDVSVQNGHKQFCVAFVKVRLQFNGSSQVFSSVGYAVLEEKKLLSRDDYTVVTGSPRDESKGSVVLGIKTEKDIEQRHIIPGEQVGSYFGSSLAVTDLDNNEYVSEHHSEN